MNKIHEFTHEDQLRLQRELDEQFKHINESVNKTSNISTNQTSRPSKLVATLDQQHLKDQLADFINHIDKTSLACDTLTFVPKLDAEVRSTTSRSRTTSSESRGRSGNRRLLSGSDSKQPVNVNKIFVSQNTRTLISDSTVAEASSTSSANFRVITSSLNGSKIDGSIVLSDDDTIEETIDLNTFTTSNDFKGRAT